MKTSKAVSGIEIRLSDERWSHIEKRHPELAGQEEKTMETISQPDMIQEGDSGELIALKHYESTPMTSKYLAVVYREIESEDGFVLTAYFTNRPSARRSALWRRPTS